jgi:sugar lactone lactonase YvrE
MRSDQPPARRQIISQARNIVAKLCLAALLVACAWSSIKTCAAQKYFFTTFAGIGGGSSDGSGSDANFNSPRSIVADKAGNLYVADTGNHTIRKINSAGVVSTVAGSPGRSGFVDGIGKAARFNHPSGVAVDNQGIIYVCDRDNSAIRKITTDGNVTTLAGGTFGSNDGHGSAAQFGFPAGLALDGAGNIYVADIDNFTIRKVSSNGDVTTVAGTPGVLGHTDGTGSNAQFEYPSAVGVDSAGNVYVTDGGLGRTFSGIRKISPNGTVTTLAGSTVGSADGTGSAAQFASPDGITIDSGGVIYVADSLNDSIRKITPGAVVTTFAGTPPHSGFTGTAGSGDGTGTSAQFNNPFGVTVAPSGDIYVADTFNNTVRKITPAALVTTLAGSPKVTGGADGTSRAARFNMPLGAAVDSSGNVYVADYGNFTVRKITPGAVVSTLAGAAGSPGTADGPGAEARFGGPTNVAVDRTGNVFVADPNNNTIRKISPEGVVSTLAGLAGSAGSADGTGGAARFSHPYGVAVDDAGNVYVSDLYNVTIRKITPAGMVSTIAGSLGVSGNADGTGSTAQFHTPTGLAVDKNGNIYVADFDRIRKVTRAGVVTTLSKTGWPSLKASSGFEPDACGGCTGDYLVFEDPEGMTVDSAGNLYVADTGFRGVGSNDIARLIKISPVGIVGPQIGSYLSLGGDEDGIGGTFNLPAGIAVDNAGNIFVSDTASNRIRIGVPLQSQLLNIATRMGVRQGDQVLIGGFIITGSDPKKVLIRGIGPSLGGFGIVGALADPTLELHQGSTIIATNDNWKTKSDGSSQQAEIEATTIPPTNDLESAIVATLTPGAYTAILAGKDAGIGVGLVEVYDLAQMADSKLANISTRGFVDTDDNVMIGGLIVGNDTGGTSKVIVRALGPSLANAGVQGALDDPALELHDGSGTLVASNDNWKTRADGSSQQAEIEATTIPPANDLESALVATLAPGNYTAVVRGKNNTTGVGLVEVYNLQ